MKTLKKTLCLVLAVVMAVGVLVIPANAAFPDEADITHDEAVAVLNGLGIFEGDDKGNFNPDTVLKRAEAAKIIAVLMQGKEAADDYVPSTVPFTDIADYAGGWAVNYIAYCADNGIIGGNGDGTFNPDGDLTGHAFAKMLLCALGYDGNNEGFGGSSWAKNVEAIARKEKMNAGISAFQYSAPLTRDSAAQMAYNALKVNKVTGYTGGTNIELPGGVTITEGADRDIDPTASLWNDFELDKLTGSAMLDPVDDFGRPNKYQIAVDGDEDALYTKNISAVKVYTSETSASTVAKDLKGYYIGATTDAEGNVTLSGAAIENSTKTWTNADSTVKKYVNGDVTGAAVEQEATTITTAAAIAKLTGNGYTVELYATTSNSKYIDRIVVLQPVLAKITNKTSTTISIGTGNNFGTYSRALSDATGLNHKWYDVLNGYAKNDYVEVILNGTGTSAVILDVAPVSTVTGKLTGMNGTDTYHKTSNQTAKTYVIDGQSYKVARGAQATFSVNPVLSSDDDATVIVDGNNNILDFAEASKTSTAVNSIYVVAGYWGPADEWGVSYAMFQGVLPDGEIITGIADADDPTDVKAGGATYVIDPDTGAYTFTYANSKTYTSTVNKDADDGVYTLNKNVSLTTSSTKLDGKNYFASDVTFVSVGDKTLGNLKVSVKTGVQKIDLESGDVVVVTKDANGNHVISTVFVTKGAYVTDIDGEDLIFIPNPKSGDIASKTGSALGDDGKAVDVYSAYLNGEEISITVASGATVKAGWHSYSIDAKTGAYKLSETDVEKTTETNVDIEITYINDIYYLTANGTEYDATEANVVDVSSKASSAPVSSIGELDTLLDTNSGVSVSFVYDADKNVTLIYVANQGTVKESDA